jgi:ubiquinone/menaquinone biosynthesis C-methylase UbiE
MPESAPKTYHDQAVRSFFDKQAVSYSNFFSEETKTGAAVLFRTRMALSVSMLAGRHGALLDCASGTGEITREVALANNWNSILVNDSSPSMIERCRTVMSELPGVCWNVGNVFDLGATLEEESYDAVLCLGLIAHCGRLPTLLQVIWDILKKDGVLLLQSSLLDHPGDFITKFVARSFFRKGDYRVNGFYLSSILADADQAGFDLVEIRRFGLCLPFGDRILGRWNYWLEAKFAHSLSRSGGESLILFKKR